MLNELFDMTGSPIARNPNHGYLGDSQKRNTLFNDEKKEFLELEGIIPYEGRQPTIHSTGGVCRGKRKA